MLRNLISILFLSLIFTCNAQLKKPVYLGSELLNCKSEDKMIQLCLGYNPTSQSIEDDYHSFSYPDNTTIQCKIDSTSSHRNLPIVKVITPDRKNDIIKNLIAVGFRKDGNVYRKGNKHTQSQTICQFDKAKPTTIIFTKQFNK